MTDAPFSHSRHLVDRAQMIHAAAIEAGIRAYDAGFIDRFALTLADRGLAIYSEAELERIRQEPPPMPELPVGRTLLVVMAAMVAHLWALGFMARAMAGERAEGVLVVSVTLAIAAGATFLIRAIAGWGRR